MDDPERVPLLANTANDSNNNNITVIASGSALPTPSTDEHAQHTRALRARWRIIGASLALVALAVVFGAWLVRGSRLSDDPLAAARQILDRAPVIDGHIDLPDLVRATYANNISAFDLHGRMPAQVDIPRLREGRVGGFFWSVYAGCKPEGPDFIAPSYRVRDTLEQIDVAHLMINKYSDTFKLALSAEDIGLANREGKIAGMLGVEGAHQLGNSLAVLRQYHALGVRYVTLTHFCHNAFADSGGFLEALEPLHGGLSKLGRVLVTELNRLGVLVDLSHTSDATARQALALSRAPVIWSHSSARAVHNVARNVPDDILALVGTRENQTDGVVMVNFAPPFVAPKGEATVERVADHVEHIGRVAGREHVGLGSDFDGIEEGPKGLEDVSKYPQLVAELYKRGWSRAELAGLAGANLLRVFRGVERTAALMPHEDVQPAMEIYGKRPDLPMHWGEGEDEKTAGRRGDL